MIGSEYQGQIQSQEHLLCHEEQDGVWQTEKEIKQAQKPTRVQNEETPFDDGMRDAVTQQESNTIIFQNEGFEQRQRKETEMLVSHREPRQPALPGCLILRKCEKRYIDVGVGGNVIRRAMVAVVLVQPPTEAKSEQEIGMNQADGLVSRRLIENLLVTCIVYDKTQLREDKREESGVANLDPRITKSIYQ
jgi:hypothetical protein